MLHWVGNDTQACTGHPWTGPNHNNFCLLPIIISSKNLHSKQIKLPNCILCLLPLQIISFFPSQPLCHQVREYYSMVHELLDTVHKNVWVFFVCVCWGGREGFTLSYTILNRVPWPLTKRWKSIVRFFALSRYLTKSLFLKDQILPLNHNERGKNQFCPSHYWGGLFKALNIYIYINFMPLILLIYYVPCENFKISIFIVV